MSAKIADARFQSSSIWKRASACNRQVRTRGRFQRRKAYYPDLLPRFRVRPLTIQVSHVSIAAVSAAPDGDCIPEDLSVDLSASTLISAEL